MRVSPRRLAGVLAIVVVAAGAVVGAFVHAGSSPDGVLPGGSAFAQRKAVLGAVKAPSTRATLPRPAVSLARGAAQLFVVGFPGSTPEAPFFSRLRKRDWGGVLLTRENGTAVIPSISDVANDAGRAAPLVIAGPGLEGMPERGPAQPATARARARDAGRTLRPLGVSVAMAPSADIGYGGGPIAAGAFSSDPAVVARSARAAVDGWRASGIAPVTGSYPGLGAASADPSESVATVGLSLDELRARDARVFHGLIGRTPAIRMSAAVYAGFDGVTPATLLPEAITMLRRAGFRGVVMSASLPATTITTGGTVAEAAVAALQAGCDMLLVPGNAADQEAAYRAVVRAVRTGKVPTARYREALARVTSLRGAYRVG